MNAEKLRLVMYNGRLTIVTESGNYLNTTDLKIIPGSNEDAANVSFKLYFGVGIEFSGECFSSKTEVKTPEEGGFFVVDEHLEKSIGIPYGTAIIDEGTTDQAFTIRIEETLDKFIYEGALDNKEETDKIRNEFRKATEQIKE